MKLLTVIAALQVLGARSQERAHAERDRAIVQRVARSIELYSLYLGVWPASLQDTMRRPAGAKFWPEGGFWFGPLPDGVVWENGTIVRNQASTTAPAPLRTVIEPPTDRLREHYGACVRLMLLRAAALAYREEYGSLPKKASDLGEVLRDPWGKPFAFKISKDRFRIGLEDAAKRQVLPTDLTKEEARALEEHSLLPLTEEDRRRASTWLSELSAEDRKTREQACQNLRRLGWPALPLLRERLSVVEDAEARGRLQDLILHLSTKPVGWQSQLRPLSTTVPSLNRAATAMDCANNLSQLWKLSYVYMSLFGGAEKKMSEATGSDFWLALRKSPLILDDTIADEILECPLSHEPVTYRGPRADVNKLPDEDAVGMCDDESHGDKAVILFKSGDVKLVERREALYKKASESTKP